jgi:hypothetical protein
MASQVYVVMRDYGCEGLGKPVLITGSLVALTAFFVDRDSGYRVFTTSSECDFDIKDVTDLWAKT